MSDEEIRGLERAARTGDSEAAARYRRTQERSGAPFVVASFVEPELPAWLVEPLLPLREIILLIGLMSAGKSPLAATIASATTRGSALPWPSPPLAQGNVLWVGEESQETVRARFDRLGADISRLGIQHEGAFLDDEVARAIDSFHPSLVVVDPATLICPPSRSPRTGLAATRAAARRWRTAVLLVMHIGKSGRNHRAIQSALGTSDAAAVARSILLLWRDPREERRLVLAQARNAYGALAESQELELQGDTIVWRGTVAVTADDLMGVVPPNAIRRATVPHALDRATEIIDTALASGPQSAGELIEQCSRVGISERTTRDAASRLGVVSRETRELGRITGWTWTLVPAAGPTTSQCCENHRTRRADLDPHGFGGSARRGIHLYPLHERSEGAPERGASRRRLRGLELLDRPDRLFDRRVDVDLVLRRSTRRLDLARESIVLLGQLGEALANEPAVEVVPEE